MKPCGNLWELTSHSQQARADSTQAAGNLAHVTGSSDHTDHTVMAVRNCRKSFEQSVKSAPGFQTSRLDWCQAMGLESGVRLIQDRHW
jgi:hypothetical protein